MSEKPEALWTVDRMSHKTGAFSKRFVFRTRKAAGNFLDRHPDNRRSRYLQPVRAQWGPES